MISNYYEYTFACKFYTKVCKLVTPPKLEIIEKDKQTVKQTILKRRGKFRRQVTERRHVGKFRDTRKRRQADPTRLNYTFRDLKLEEKALDPKLERSVD